MNEPRPAAAVPADARGRQLVDSAAKLARYCAGLLSDAGLSDAGTTVFYAIDADIVGLYMAPEERAHYADVFGRRDPLLARLLSDYLLLEFNLGPAGKPRAPLLLVPPHDDQVARMILRITERYVDDIEEADSAFDRLTDSQASTSVTNMQPPDLASWLIEHAGVLIEVFDGRSGPAAELRRFTALPEDRLLNIEQYFERESNWAFPLPDVSNDATDLERFSQTVADWRRSLVAHRSRRQPRYSVDEDAIVLATIEWLNAALEGSNRKIVLVTGTSGIWASAASEQHRITRGRHAGQLFSDVYIRHPQAFMACRDFFFRRDAAGEEPVFNLFEWLNLMFPNVWRVGDSGSAVADVSQLPPTPALAEDENPPLAPASQRAGPQAKDDRTVLEEWNTQIKAAAVSRKVDQGEQDWSDRAARLLDWLRNRMSSGWTLERLRADIISRAVQSLSAMYSSTVWLGLWSQLRKSPEMARGIPALRFEAPYEQAQTCYRLVVNAMHTDDEADARADSLNLHQMLAQLRSIDDSNYVSHVIHALAYATKGHWYATRTLCQIALRIAKDLAPGVRGNRRGREASYLMAVAERRLARDAAGLAAARRHLEEAIARRDPGAPEDLRFESEALSLEAAAFNFRYFAGDAGLPPAAAVAIPLIDRGLALLASVDRETVPEVCRWVEQQTVTVTLSLALIAAERAASADVVQRARRVLRYVHDHLPCRQVVAADGVADFVHAAASAVFDEHQAVRRNAHKRLGSLVFPVSRPYDEARESLFRQLAMRS